MTTRYYLKSLDHGLVSAHGFIDGAGVSGWPLPHGKQAGAWKPEVSTAQRPLRPHHWGYHLARLEHAASWFYRENFLAEAGGEIVEGWDCAVATRARLVRHLPVSEAQWAALALDFAADIHTLPAALGFPHDISSVVANAYTDARAWMAGADNAALASAHGQLAVAVAGRNLLDAGRCIQYAANSQAVAHAALAVSDLLYLRRDDGVRLIDTIDDSHPSARALQRGPLRKLWIQGQAAQSDITCNSDVARSVCGHAAQAAEAAVRQAEILQSTGHTDDAAILHENLSPLMVAWRAASTLPDDAAQSHHALSGIRARQTARLLPVFGL